MPSNGEGEHLLLTSQIGRPSLCPSTLLKPAMPLHNYATIIKQQCLPAIIKAGMQPVCAWFFRIASVRKRVCACVCVRVCVCLPLRLLITSGVMWCDIDPI